MPRPIRIEYEDAYYHVMNRGRARQKIFHGDNYFEVFLTGLSEAHQRFGMQILCYCLMDNHYHFIAVSSPHSLPLNQLISKLHMITAKAFNQQDHQNGRRIWFQFWDSKITFERSYLARLNYVHYNPAKHRKTMDATNYPWCSAAWFERTAPTAFVQTVHGFKTNKLRVIDDF